jgi:hypothetical protein
MALSFITLETVAVDTFAIRAMSFREMGIEDGFSLNVYLNRLRKRRDEIRINITKGCAVVKGFWGPPLFERTVYENVHLS